MSGTVTTQQKPGRRVRLWRVLTQANSWRLLASAALRLPWLLRCIPRPPFRKEEQDVALDYRSLAGWCAHPRRLPGQRAVEDVNHLATPVGKAVEPPPPVADRPCDCFFVHDSCLTMQESMPFLGELAPRWTAPVQDGLEDQISELRAKVNEQVDLRVAAGAAPFNRLCRVYAPRYRQVNVVALALYMPPSPAHRWEDLRGAIELAYKDVATAFVQFVEDSGNAGRPFFLAGHSQGTMHLMRLLQEEVEPYPDRRDRFVHGYLAGQTVPLRMFQTLRHVRPSIRATDICSVSSWRTGAPQHRVLVHCGMIFHLNAGWLPLTGKILATNPVTWEAGAANRASHLQEYMGAAFPLPENLDPRESEGLASGVVLRFGSLVASKKAILGARLKANSPVDCGEVTVVVDEHSVTRVPKLPSTSLFATAEHDWLMYHDVDIALFHGNLQANAEQRHQAWQMRGRSRM
eukprot:s3145_g1.t1